MRIMRLKEVIDTTGLARSTIYKYIADGIFPKPVNLAPAGIDVPSTRAVGWLQGEVEDWILARIEERDLAEGSATRPSSHLSVAR
ncbi:AlpA family transcriptional regulator [Pseudomonas aeruginosa]|jgi:prophage regulatory protein|uniref:AlpA family phage regulatory protein n=1 Tax=Metapseudomonas otitidis TaxID=319939 RepID=A0A7X3H460_9GAMM|nr:MULTISPECIES: AlpA family transcriptional regulator [Pseudomonadaceae]ASA28997.1 AlpA family transcriptional regulator [Pseudomonas aeruginosa]ASD03386.1 AlpA family transcriptional regulator [Pseudomonas aeruginosa]EIU1298335.1 AlpA family transcriptional regulator [Pseudomonas aeruginosa]EIU1459196.1 AlpA family transcriptional regulator [Pseudomonas aeruginosa]EIU2577470.1 AlpA family transcriptional regulator [Pseudomonas aeruginosa]